MPHILGIDVDDALLARWRGYYAPGYQLFRREGLSEAAQAVVPAVDLDGLPMEVCDTFDAYGGSWGSLDEAAYRALDGDVRAELEARRAAEEEADLFRWPSQLATDGDAPLIAFVEEGAAASRHAEVPERVWAGCADLLPGARGLAGRFARGSGPNCFGNVGRAAGLPPESDRLDPGPFEEFLAQRAVRDDDASTQEPAIVLVWRRADGRVHHAAVTLGEGWVLNKPAQAWWAPRYVWTVEQTLCDNEATGAPERHRLLPRPA